MKRHKISLAVIQIVIFVVVSLPAIKVTAQAETPLYLDSKQPIEKRVEDLLARMTLEEKIGQMNMPCVYLRHLGRDVPSKMEACKAFTEGVYVDSIGPAGGFFTMANNILHKGARQQAEFYNELQKIALEKTRLKIPLLQTEEGTHGLMCSGATIFPEGVAIGSMWNPDLTREIYTIAAREARAVGIHQLYTLVIEPIRDPRLGRNQEAYSEDAFLTAQIARAIVEGVQGDDISATDRCVAGLCHYPGQSQPVGGLERGAMEISERTLREVFLPPWVMGIKHCGALGVMATYPAIDGVPVHGSKKILTDILRQELGFEGLVLSEGGGIGTLVYTKVVHSQKEAGALAIKAGVDVGISFEEGYMAKMIENVNEGLVSIDLIDRSVRRILTLKYQLGLFEKPYVDPDHAVNVSNTEEHQKIALEAAREGIVLLKNENQLLPLDKNISSIAVIGPNADHGRNQLGDYTSKTILQDIVTVLDGIEAKVSDQTRVVYAKGCQVVGTDASGLSEAREAAESCDIAVVVVGENERRAPDNEGTNGEARDVASLDLTGLQRQLVQMVYETGTPTVVVLVNGRPISIPWIAENIPAIVESWNSGEEGGYAVADILFGDVNPSGRLAITIPRHVGQLPVYYDYKPSKAYYLERSKNRGHIGYVDMSAEPLFEFGFGLSYTKFEYSDLKLSQTEIGSAGQVKIEVAVKNSGDRAGAEVVQLYINDVVSSITTPVKELKGFKKIYLKPGEQKTVRFTLGPDELSFLDHHLQPVVEPGEFEIMIGRSSDDIRQRTILTVRDKSIF